MNEVLLKKDLKQIKKQKYKVSNNELYAIYALDMLKYIGTTDAELRDDLIYDIFAHWVEKDRFSNVQLATFLKICLNDRHLMYKVGAEGEDNVFTRTFSALIIELILEKNNQKAFLTAQSILKTKNIFMYYYAEEKDLRGYVGKNGWAHSVAHGADVIDQLAKCQDLGKKDLQQLLSLLKLKICQGKYVYIDGEPDRINVAVKSILDRQLIDKDEFVEWLKGLNDETLDPALIESYHQKVNLQNFLRSLYFTLKGNYQQAFLIGEIGKLLDH